MWHLRLVKLKNPYPDTSITMKQKTLEVARQNLNSNLLS